MSKVMDRMLARMLRPDIAGARVPDHGKSCADDQVSRGPGGIMVSLRRTLLTIAMIGSTVLGTGVLVASPADAAAKVTYAISPVTNGTVFVTVYYPAGGGDPIPIGFVNVKKVSSGKWSVVVEESYCDSDPIPTSLYFHAYDNNNNVMTKDKHACGAPGKGSYTITSGQLTNPKKNWWVVYDGVNSRTIAWP